MNEQVPEVLDLDGFQSAFASIQAYLMLKDEPMSNPIWETVKYLEREVDGLKSIIQDHQGLHRAAVNRLNEQQNHTLQLIENLQEAAEGHI